MSEVACWCVDAARGVVAHTAVGTGATSKGAAGGSRAKPAAILGYFALHQAPEIWALSMLALTGGTLASVVVEEMPDQAHEGDTSVPGPILLTGGVALFAAISVYLGS